MPVNVHVQNFQSIKDAEIEIKGFTVITGQNNGGKSALMRAIRGAFQNTRGTSFVRHGTAKSMVTVDMGNGHTVYWEKGPGKTKPTYIIDNGPVIHPGQAVPEELSVLGVSPITAGGREIWPQFAPQFSQIFLLDQPGSVLAEAVADVDRVSKLNQALRLSEQDRRAFASELKVRRKDAEKLLESLKFFEGLDTVVSMVEGLEESEQKIEKAERILGTVLYPLQVRYKKASETVDRFTGVDQITLPDSAMVDDIKHLVGEIDQIRLLQDRLIHTQKSVKNLEGVASVTIAIDTDLITRLQSALNLVKQLQDRYSQSLAQIDTYQEQLKQAQKEAVFVAEALKIYLADKGTCPICGSNTREG